MSTTAPPQPVYILRAHAAAIHALHFTPSNTHLLSGDSDGHIIIWHLPTRRALSIFRPHTAALLAITTTPTHILTHARDHTLKSFRFPAWDTSVPLPAGATTASPQNPPEQTAELAVNALNFCGFAACEDEAGTLVAVPAAMQQEAVDVMRLDGRRAHKGVTAGVKTGMAMGLVLEKGEAGLRLCAGYESGHVAVMEEKGGRWETVFIRSEHTQPVLSLCAWDGSLWSSGADARVVRYRWGEGEVRARDTGHQGQQDVCVRGDGKLICTAGWDGAVRVYKAGGGMRELAVLKWHREGVYAVAFARMLEREEGEGNELVVRGVEEERVLRETGRHWIAAGAKDGKVSLWEIY